MFRFILSLVALVLFPSLALAVALGFDIVEPTVVVELVVAGALVLAVIRAGRHNGGDDGRSGKRAAT